MKVNIFFAAVPNHDNRQLLTQKILQCEAKRSSQLRIDWSHLTDLHITLGYLSGVEDTDLRAIAQSFLFLNQTTKFLATIKDVRIFGNAIVLRMEPYQTFLGLFKKMKQQLQNTLENKYQFKEHDRFDAHITIGRIQTPRTLTNTQKLQLCNIVGEQFVNTTIVIQQVALMQRIPDHLAKNAKSAQQYQALQGYNFK